MNESHSDRLSGEIRRSLLLYCPILIFARLFGEHPVNVRRTDLTNNLEALAMAVNIGVERVIASQHQFPDPLWHLKELQQAADEGWLLTTAEVKELIAVKPVVRKGV